MTPFVIVTQQAPGALANGCRVRKVNSEPGDIHGDGEMATVVASLSPALDDPVTGQPEYGYFVRFDDLQQPVFVRGRRLEIA